MTSPHKLAVFAGAPVAIYGLLLRPRLLRWGASDDEVASRYPGVGVVQDARRTATMAVTINAPPSAVWPWLVQMGCDRAGWYSWDRLDNGGRASAEYINPEWQQLAIGDRMASTPTGGAWFKVAALEPQRFLGLRASLDLRGRPFDTDRGPPRFYIDSLWGFMLHELPGRRTRLVVSGYADSRPRFLIVISDFLFWEPAHALMQTRQFTNLKRRADADYACCYWRPVQSATRFPLLLKARCVRLSRRISRLRPGLVWAQIGRLSSSWHPEPFGCRRR